jgi:hypothetical protein
MSPGSVDLLSMAHGLGFPTSSTASSPDTLDQPVLHLMDYESDGSSFRSSSDLSEDTLTGTSSWLERGFLATPRAWSSPPRGFAATKLADEYPPSLDQVSHSCSLAVSPYRPPGRKVPHARAAATPAAAALLANQPELFRSVSVATTAPFIVFNILKRVHARRLCAWCPWSVGCSHSLVARSLPCVPSPPSSARLAPLGGALLLAQRI